MDPYITALATGTVSVLTIAGAFAYSRSMIATARAQAADIVDATNERVDDYVLDTLGYLADMRKRAAQRLNSVGVDRAALFREAQELSEMVLELREERDNLSTELAVLKVDAVEADRVADAYANQVVRLDAVVSHLTDRLNRVNEHWRAGESYGRVADDHAESLIRTGLAVSRGPGVVGRADDLAFAA